MADDLPAELREAAGRAAHAAYRARPHSKQHAPEDCPCRDGHDTECYDTDDCDTPCGRCNATCYGRPHDKTTRPCLACRPALRAWDDLTEAARETFRVSQDPALSLVAPVLAECAAALRESSAWHERESMALGPPCLARALACLAALGVRP